MDELENNNLWRLLQSPLVDLDEIQGKFSSGELLTIARGLDAIAEKAIRMAEYLETRANMNDHAEAVKQSNKRIAKVRKAMGYTYPRQDLNF